MTAANQDLVIEQYTDWTYQFIYEDGASNPMNLTGYTGRMQIRTAPGGTVLWDSNTSGSVALGGATGTVTVTIPSATTGAFSFASAVYDVLVTSPGGLVYRVATGKVTLSLGVTH